MSTPLTSATVSGLKNWRLWQQIAAALVVVTLVVSFVAGEIARRVVESHLDRSFALQNQHLVAALSAASAGAVAASDRPGLNRIAEGVASREPDLVALVITNTKGEEVVRWSRGTVNGPVRAFAEALVHSGHRLGTLTVQVGVGRWQQSAVAHAGTVRALVIISLFLLSATILGCLHFLLFRPMGWLSRRILNPQRMEASTGTCQLTAHEFVGLENVLNERLRTEEELRQAHAELDARVQDRTRALELEISERRAAEKVSQEAREVAEAANAAKSDFLATMSHEIRTPMNSVLGFANILLGTRLDEEQLDFVQTIRSSGESLLALINDILDFSRIEAGQLQLEPAPVDLAQIVEEVCSLLAVKADEKRVELALYCDPNLPRQCLADSMRLRQILLNLVGNAIKFTDRGHVLVEVAFKRSSSSELSALHPVTFSVTDTGIGISPAQQRLLFRKFQQGDSSATRRFGGTGLGLAICRLLVERMGGTIVLESSVGKGSTFSFTLPLEAPSGDGPNLPEFPLGRDRVRALVLERAPINRKLIHRQLAGWGIECECVDRFSDALSTLRTAQAVGDPFDVVFVELTLTDRDGMQFAQEVRREPTLKSTGLVLIASSPHRGDTTMFYSRGFAATLLKPLVRQQALLDALRKGVDQRNQLKQEEREGSSRSAFAGRFGSHLEPVNESGRSSSNPLTPSSSDSSPLQPPDVSRFGGVRLEKLDAKVLLVEDNDVNLKLARRLLEKMGCRIVAAVNGKEAIDRAQIEGFDLVLMDCQMPEMDGFEATRELRRLEGQGILPDPGLGRLPIVALTANAVQGDRARCIEAGMDDYVTKPVSAEELHTAVQKWIRPKKARLTSY